MLQVAPLVSPIDERGQQLGGAQVLFADLARVMAARGHDVVIAAAEGSFVRGTRLAPLGIDSRELRPADLGVTAGARGDAEAQRHAFARVRTWIDEHAGELDVVHAHAYDAPAFDLLAGARVPVIHTLHLPPHDAGVVAAARSAARAGATLVTVSDANARAWRERDVAVDAVIANGIELGEPPRVDRGRHLLFVGRVSPEKGVADAIVAARDADRPLLIVGGIYDAAYYEREVAPHVRAAPEWHPGDDVTGALFAGPRTREDVRRIMATAAATLMPVRWDEPFGLVAVESLAAGTPVAAYRRGALGEIVDNTCGALAEPDDRRDLVRAIGDALTRGHDSCRRRAEHFSLDRMAERYERLMREVIAARPRSH